MSGKQGPAILDAAFAAEVADRKFLATIASNLPWEQWAVEIGYEQFQVVRAVSMMDRFGRGDDKAICADLEITEVDLIQIRKTVVYDGLKTEIARLLAEREYPVEVGDAIRGEAPRLVRDMILTARLSPDDELRTRVVTDLLDREYPKKGRDPKSTKQQVLVLPERVIEALQRSPGSPAGFLVENADDGEDGEG